MADDFYTTTAARIEALELHGRMRQHEQMHHSRVSDDSDRNVII